MKDEDKAEIEHLILKTLLTSNKKIFCLVDRKVGQYLQCSRIIAIGKLAIFQLYV